MQIETRLSDQLARYLDLAAGEAKLTAANMANIDTPGYRAVGMDFEAEMQRGHGRGEPGQRGATGAGESRGWADCASGRQRCLDGPREPEPGRGATEVQDRRGAAARRNTSG